MLAFLLALATAFAADPAPQLEGNITVDGLGAAARVVTVHNHSETPWTNVFIQINGGTNCFIEEIAPYDSDHTMLATCDGDKLDNAQIRLVQVSTDQGDLVLLEGRIVSNEEAAAIDPSEMRGRGLPSSDPDQLPFTARVTVGFGPLRGIKLGNWDDQGWTACEITLNETYRKWLPRLHPHDEDFEALGGFRDQHGRRMTSNEQILRVDIECDQGRATVRP